MIYRPMRQKNALKVYLMIAGLGINIFVPNFMLQIVGGLCAAASPLTGPALPLPSAMINHPGPG